MQRMEQQNRAGEGDAGRASQSVSGSEIVRGAGRRGSKNSDSTAAGPNDRGADASAPPASEPLS